MYTIILYKHSYDLSFIMDMHSEFYTVAMFNELLSYVRGP